MADSATRDRIVLADDHPVFRDGMRRIIQGIVPTAVICEAASFDEVIAQARNGSAPETFVLDLLFPGFEPRRSIAELREEFPLATIIIVSMIDNAEAINRVMLAGADGFVGKAVPAREIAQAIESIRNGEAVVLRASEGTLDGADEDSTLSRLTARQIDVLLLMAAGRSNKEIARDLDISPFTVRIHVSAILRVLGVQTRAAAASLATEAGFVMPPRG